MLKPAPDYREKIAPYRPFFTWDITYKCNYRCSYCSFNEPGGWKDPEPTVNPGLEAWVEIWNKIYEKYGSCQIHFAGGEPFVYPNFMDLLKELSRIHTMEFSTNLCWEPVDFMRSVRPRRARIGVSFHPEFVSFETFFEKVRKLKEAGFEVWVNYVGYPPIFSGIQEFKEKFERVGVPMSILPFKGEYKDRRYPEGYTEEERQYLKKCTGTDIWTQKMVDFTFTKEKRETKSRLCRMGQMYAKIHSNGDAFNCCAKTAKKLGNVIDGTFSFLEEPLICEDDNCPCWKGMVIGKEEFWAKHWVVPPAARDLSNLYSRNGEKNENTKFKVVLVQAPVCDIFKPPLALTQLSSCLKQKEFEVRIFDLNIELYKGCREEYKNIWAIEQSIFWANEDSVKIFFNDNFDLVEEYINKIVETDPVLIGFSVNVCSLPATMELAKRIKQKIPLVKVVIGGPIFSAPFDVSSILKHNCIDVIVLGEGEETFCEVSRLFRERRELSSCKGIYFI